MGREGRNHTICEEKAWYYAFTSTGTPINPLFTEYSLNSHFRAQCCAQHLKFVSPRMKTLVKILIFNFDLHVEFEKVAATGSPGGKGCTERAAIFVADCKRCFDVCPMPVVLMIFVQTLEYQEPLFISILCWDWLQKKTKASELASGIQNASQGCWGLISEE